MITSFSSYRKHQMKAYCQGHPDMVMEGELNLRLCERIDDVVTHAMRNICCVIRSSANGKAIISMAVSYATQKLWQRSTLPRRDISRGKRIPHRVIRKFSKWGKSTTKAVDWGNREWGLFLDVLPQTGVHGNDPVLFDRRPEKAPIKRTSLITRV